jgi:hypothetical protein
MAYYDTNNMWNGYYGQKPGADVYGSKVAPVTMPNPAADLAKQFPNLTGTNAAASNLINSQLMGQIGPDTMNAIKDAGAAWGFQMGVPGSNFAENNTLRNLGLTKLAVQNQGIQNYNSTIPTISSTQTVNPALQADISLQNNVNAAAPDPTAAGSYAQSLFQQYLNNLSGNNPTASNKVEKKDMFWAGSGWS